LTRDDDSKDSYDYHVSLQPFSIVQLVNGEITSSTSGTMYYENRTTGETESSSNYGGCFDALKDRAQTRSGMDIYGQDTGDIKQSVAMSFWLPGSE
jgi:hypothetical protein